LFYEPLLKGAAGHLLPRGGTDSSGKSSKKPL
jgi:hypothetical protein